jgi:hypothetical protein
MCRALSILAVGILISIADLAQAGGEFSAWFEPFPLTRARWEQNTLGSHRTVRLEQLGAGDRLVWRVDFWSAAQQPFSQSAGSFELTAPAGCGSTVLAVADFGHRGEARFERLLRAHHGEPVDAAAVEELVARFDREFEPITRVELAPERCEVLRERCAAGVKKVPAEFRATLHPPYAASFSPTSRPSIGCDPIEKAVQVCRDWGARMVMDYERRLRSRPCRGLVVATRADDAKGIELRVIDADGVEWGRQIVRPEQTTRRAAWILAPLTIPLDLVLMGLQLIWIVIVSLFGWIVGAFL